MVHCLAPDKGQNQDSRQKQTGFCLNTTEKLKTKYLSHIPQFTSSDPSLQSGTVSHTQDSFIHRPSDLHCAVQLSEKRLYVIGLSGDYGL